MAFFNRLLDFVNDKYNGKEGVYAQLRNARDEKIQWWDDEVPSMVRWCAENHEDDPVMVADCEMAAYLLVGIMKKNIMLTYWAAMHTAEVAERLEVQICGLKFPCAGKNAGDPK